MDKFLKKYAEIMNVYRNGGFGSDHLTFYEIMSKAGDPDFFDKMTLSEIQSLISSSSGMTKQFFLKKREKKQIALKKQKLEEE